MANDDGTTWREISPYLDVALDLDPRAREQWLQELDARLPAIAIRVKTLLEERERAEERDFLGASPAGFLGHRMLAGQQFGAYTLEAVLGQGGMGTVWRVHRSDGRFEGCRAIKVLSAALVGRPAEHRFVREGSLLAKLQHPHIAQLLDAGIAHGGQPYLVLEYVQGARIDRYCEARALGVEDRIRVFLDVLDAVAHAHSRLIVHRDLKPSNIFVTDEGVVKLLDFGVATLITSPTQQDPAAGLTRELNPGLTPEYAAPEQLLGQTVTTATDVYALGLVLFVLLVGRHPAAPEGKSAAELMRMTLDGETPRPSHVAADTQRGRVLRGDLDNIIAKTLKKNPAERYATVDAFASDLRRFLAQQPVSAHADSVSYRAGKFVRRHRGGVAAGALMTLALLATTSFALLQMRDARLQRDAAIEQRQRAESFNNTITSLLSQVGPGGRALTPEELLDRAAEETRLKYADDAPTLVNMLILISGRYYDLRNEPKEYESLLQAEAVARKARDPKLVLAVQCSTVETELDGMRLPAARQRMNEARRLLADLGDVDVGLQADCLRAQGQLAAVDHDFAGALAAFQKARAMLEAANRTSGNIYSGILSLVAGYSGRAGHFVDAQRYWQQLDELHRRYGRHDSTSGVITRAQLAYSFYELGQVHRARAIAKQALGTLQTADFEHLNVTVSTRYGEVMSRSGENDTALALLQSAVASANRSGIALLVVRVNLAMAQALLRAGRVDEAERPLEEAAKLQSKGDQAEPSRLIEVRRVRAEIRLAQNRIDEAAAELAAVLRELGYPQNASSPYLAAVLASNARLELLRGRNAAAFDFARQAAELFGKLTADPEQSADVGESLLLQALAQSASGRNEAARTSADRAMRVLNMTLGPSHASTQRARQLAGG